MVCILSRRFWCSAKNSFYMRAPIRRHLRRQDSWEYTNFLQEKRILEQQLLTEQEIHELGLQALVPWLESHNFKIDYMQTDMNTVPHIFALSGKILTVIIAATSMYPHKGVVGEADKAYAMRVATQLGALCATASIGLVNVDGLPDDKKLMGTPMRNGHYKADFSGLEYIHYTDNAL